VTTTHIRRELDAYQKAVGELDDVDAQHVYARVEAALAASEPVRTNDFLRDVYDAAGHSDVPEGTCVGTSDQFVGLAIGWADAQRLLLPDEADKIVLLLQRAAAKVRAGDGGK
jgi:hypothetical protein